MSQTKQLPTYFDVNIKKLRKCPNCHFSHYRKSIVTCKNTEYKFGILVQTYYPELDAGSHFTCLNCGLDIAQDGSWEFDKFILTKLQKCEDK